MRGILFYLNTTSGASNASENFNVHYYKCEWNVDPAVRYISGRVTSYYKITTAANSISFDLADSLITDSVKQKNTFLSFIHTNNTLEIDFSNSVASGTEDSVCIYYHGVPPDTVWVLL